MRIHRKSFVFRVQNQVDKVDSKALLLSISNWKNFWIANFVFDFIIYILSLVIVCSTHVVLFGISLLDLRAFTLIRSQLNLIRKYKIMRFRFLFYSSRANHHQQFGDRFHHHSSSVHTFALRSYVHGLFSANFAATPDQYADTGADLGLRSNQSVSLVHSHRLGLRLVPILCLHAQVLQSRLQSGRFCAEKRGSSFAATLLQPNRKQVLERNLPNNAVQLQRGRFRSLQRESYISVLQRIVSKG